MAGGEYPKDYGPWTDTEIRLMCANASVEASFASVRALEVRVRQLERENAELRAALQPASQTNKE